MSTNPYDKMSGEDGAAYAWFIKSRNDFLLSAQHGEHNLLACYDKMLKSFRAQAQRDREVLLAMAATILGGMADGRQTIFDNMVREAARAARALMAEIDRAPEEVDRG